MHPLGYDIFIIRRDYRRWVREGQGDGSSRLDPLSTSIAFSGTVIADSPHGFFNAAHPNAAATKITAAISASSTGSLLPCQLHPNTRPPPTPLHMDN